MTQEPIPIPMEDDLLHDEAHPFCPDDKCGCHEDPLLIASIQNAYQEGLVTSEEATNVVAGRTL